MKRLFVLGKSLDKSLCEIRMSTSDYYKAKEAGTLPKLIERVEIRKDVTYVTCWR